MKFFITNTLFFLLISPILLILGCKSSTTDSTPPGPVWVTFTRANSPGLIDNNIRTIYCGSESRIWFGTDSGAASYLSGSWSAIKDSLNYIEFGQGGDIISRKVTSITEGKGGALWFGLYGGGVRKYNRNNPSVVWQRYTADHGELPSDFITGIVADKFRNGDVWITTLAGVSHYTPTSPIEGTWDPASSYSSHFPSSQVRGATLNPANGWVFFATHNGVPYVYFDNEWTWGWYQMADQYNSPVMSIAVDYSNRIWLGKMYGVTSWKPGSSAADAQHYNNSNTNDKLPNAVVNAVAVDYFHTTRWFGTDNGLSRLRDTTWTLFNQANTPELPSNKIQALSYDNNGNLWIGTDQGIAVYNEGGTRIK